VAKISVLLNAKTARFNRGMRGASKSMGLFSKSVGRVKGLLGGLGSKLLLVGGAAGMGFLIRKTSKAIDNIAKMSDRLGISTKALSRFELAAELSGTELSTLEKGIKTFQKRISEAGQLTTSARIFDALKIDTTTFALKKADEQLLIFLDALSKVQLQSDKARIAQDAFGRAGLSFINLAKGGRKSIEQLLKAADLAGLTFDRLSGAAVERANDALTKLKAVGTGLLRKFVIKLAPFLEKGANALFKFLTQGKRLDRIVNKAFQFMKTAIIAAAGAVDVLHIKLLKLLNFFTDLRIGVLQTFADIGTSINESITRAVKKGGLFSDVKIGLLQTASDIAEAIFGKTEDIQKKLSSAVERRNKRVAVIRKKEERIAAGEGLADKVFRFFQRIEQAKTPKGILQPQQGKGLSIFAPTLAGAKAATARTSALQARQLGKDISGQISTAQLAGSDVGIASAFARGNQRITPEDKKQTQLLEDIKRLLAQGSFINVGGVPLLVNP